MPSLLWEFPLLLSIYAFYVGYDHLKFILKVWKNCESLRDSSGGCWTILNQFGKNGWLSVSGTKFPSRG
jgi:hypothetical protein